MLSTNVAVVNRYGSIVKMTSSSHDRNQLAPSIEKLFHYLAVYVKQDTEITVYAEDDSVIFHHTFLAPREINVSPTLFTRLDGCHGAGNCCRVPFDLVYTDYDYSRIVEYDHDAAVEQFGIDSAMNFKYHRNELLDRLVELRVLVKYPHSSINNATGKWETNTLSCASTIWVQRNTTKQVLSGNKSCPYLEIGNDRYFCGAHPFKPLHCWYPHMTVRLSNARAADAKPPSVSIGRIQYGRNHNFGCPVIFGDVVSDQPVLFGNMIDSKSYFKQQYQDDYEKLEWTAKSAESLGLNRNMCVAPYIHVLFKDNKKLMRDLINMRKPRQVLLWSDGKTY